MPVNDEEGIQRREPDDSRSERRPRRDDDARDDRLRRRNDDDRDREDHDDNSRRRIRRDDDGYRSSLIPYKNPSALAAYYCGVFGLISCFLLLGIFGILPVILGYMGLGHAKKHPEAGGKGHAIAGIVLGYIEILCFLVEVGLIVAAIMNR